MKRFDEAEEITPDVEIGGRVTVADLLKALAKISPSTEVVAGISIPDEDGVLSGQVMATLEVLELGTVVDPQGREQVYIGLFPRPLS